jgi:hypothetical protein
MRLLASKKNITLLILYACDILIFLAPLWVRDHSGILPQKFVLQLMTHGSLISQTEIKNHQPIENR